MDLAQYRDDVLSRFANPNTGHTTVQVAMDGSQKLPQRLLGTVRDRLDSGAVPTAAAAAVAAWIAYVRATSQGELEVDGRQVGLDDPLAPTLAAAADGPLDSLADRMLDVRAVFGDDLAGSDVVPVGRPRRCRGPGEHPGVAGGTPRAQSGRTRSEPRTSSCDRCSAVQAARACGTAHRLRGS